MLIHMPEVPLGNKDGSPLPGCALLLHQTLEGPQSLHAWDEVHSRELELATTRQSMLRFLSGRVAAQVAAGLPHLHPDGH